MNHLYLIPKMTGEHDVPAGGFSACTMQPIAQDQNVFTESRKRIHESDKDGKLSSGEGSEAINNISPGKARDAGYRVGMLRTSDISAQDWKTSVSGMAGMAIATSRKQCWYLGTEAQVGNINTGKYTANEDAMTISYNGKTLGHKLETECAVAAINDRLLKAQSDFLVEIQVLLVPLADSLVACCLRRLCDDDG